MPPPDPDPESALRAVLGLVLLLLAACGGAAPTGPSGPSSTPLVLHSATASSSEPEHPPAHAIDHDPKTRWSSTFSDDEWFEVELESTAIVAGVRVHWETAAGRDYDLLVSADGVTWRRVAGVRNSDGRIDEILFPPAPAHRIRLQGFRRQTCWGYSIIECEVLGPGDLPRVSATATDAGGQPRHAMDGDTATAWRGRGPIFIDLCQRRDLDGVAIEWQGVPPLPYNVAVSTDSKTWKSLGEVAATDGGTDLITCRRTPARYLRISWPAAATAAIRDLCLREAEKTDELTDHYTALSSRLPRGALPAWLERRQTYWTIVGVPVDREESLLGEEGTLEPWQGSFSVMPLVRVGGKASTAREVPITRSLEKGYLPIPTVRLNGSGWHLSVTAFAFGDAGRSVTATRYRLENTGTARQSIALGLAIRPLLLDPPWQNAGPSPIHKIERQENLLVINDRPAVLFGAAPDTFSAAGAGAGDAYEWFSGDTTPGIAAAAPAGARSALATWRHDLAPGEAREIVLLFPLHGTASLAAARAALAPGALEQELIATRDRWCQLLERCELRVTEPHLVEAWRANLAHLLINLDDRAIQPGSRNYSRSFVRDGASAAAAFLRSGITEPVRDYAEWLAANQRPTGEIPCVMQSDGKVTAEKEYDNQGEFIYIVADYYRFTRDRAFLHRVYPAVEKATRFIETLIAERTTREFENTRFYGIFPLSISHEGFAWPGAHSYFDDWWALKGLKDAAGLADELGKPSDAARFRKVETELRRNLHKSIERTMRECGQVEIPASAEGSLDACGNSIAVFPTEEDLNEPARLWSFENWYQVIFCRDRSPVLKYNFTPYEIRIATSCLMTGYRAHALEMLRYFLSVMRPLEWGVWAECVSRDPRDDTYMGDMPHGWVSGDYICAARSFLVYERDGALILGEGLDPQWLGGDGVMVGNLPTHYGNVSYEAQLTGTEVRVTVSGAAARRPAKGIFFTLPGDSTTVQGVEFKSGAGQLAGDRIRLDNLPADFTIRFSKTPAIAVRTPAAAASGQGANKLVNGDFETGDGSGWVGWSFDVQVNGAANHSAHGGKALSAALGNAPEGGFIQEIKGMQAGDKFLASAWIKAENLKGRSGGNAEALIKLEFWCGGTQIKSLESDRISGTSDWKKVTINETIPDGTTVIKILLMIKNNGGKGSDGKAFFDDVYFGPVF